MFILSYKQEVISLFIVTHVAKIGRVYQDNDNQNKYILHEPINQFENIEPALLFCDYYNETHGGPVTIQHSFPPTSLADANTKEEYWLGYVVYDTRKQTYDVKGCIENGNIGIDPQPVFYSGVYYNNVPLEVAQLAVDYYNENERKFDVGTYQLFGYTYFPSRTYI